MPNTNDPGRAPQGNILLTGETHADFIDRWRVLRAAFYDESPLDGPDDTMDFSGALIAVKAGHHITREGWNRAGLFVMAQAGYPDGIPINQNTADATGLPQGTMCSFAPYLMLGTPARFATAKEVEKGTVVTGPVVTSLPAFTPWVPSMGDLMATDWRIVNRLTLP